MAIAKLAIQCETVTGITGTFLYKDINGHRCPVTPVFDNAGSLFEWCRVTGWTSRPDTNGDEYETIDHAIALAAYGIELSYFADLAGPDDEEDIPEDDQLYFFRLNDIIYDVREFMRDDRFTDSGYHAFYPMNAFSGVLIGLDPDGGIHKAGFLYS